MVPWLMKSSQSNFDLRSPSSYLACSYLIATVMLNCRNYLLCSNLSQHHANSQDFNSSHPLKKELTIAERKIQDLRQVWYLTILLEL